MKVFEQKFDPLTGLPVKNTPPPINTRTMLYHPTRQAIIVEGKGESDQAKREDVARQIKAKERDGYSLTRFHGQHPHSNDDHRLDAQRRAAEAGDKQAIAALKAKGRFEPAAAETPAKE